MKTPDRWTQSAFHISDIGRFFKNFHFPLCWDVIIITGGFLSVAYLSFCQFQGFWFWFQHQGEGEEDEEEKARRENHHDVGVPGSLLSTGTRVNIDLLDVLKEIY